LPKVDEDHEEATMVHARPLALHAITLAALSVLAACGVEADRAPSSLEAASEATAEEAAFLRELVSESGDESARGDDDTVVEWVYVSCKGTDCLAAGIRRHRARLADEPAGDAGDVLDRDDSDRQAGEVPDDPDDAPAPTTL
jgi:hypothetical protein